MTSLAARRGERAVGAWSERLLAALPLASVFVWLCLLYAWQAWGHPSPWLFKDELEYTQLSRSIAETGESARRGEPETFETLYAYLTAPAWLIDDTETAYETAKFIGVLVMTSVLFPVYALARLLLTRRTALYVAAASTAIPGFMYASLLVREPLAYPYTALCLFLAVKALATGSWRWLAAAALVSLGAPLIRGQLWVLPAVLAVAALLVLWRSEHGRRLRAGWRPLDWIAIALVALSGALAVNRLTGAIWGQWERATEHPASMLEHGLWALGAFTIGIGLLPVLAAVAVLAWSRPAGVHEAAYRSFVAVTAVATSAFVLYAAGKAAYLATFFESRVEERNLIYLSPLAFVAMGIWLERRRVALLPLAAGAALVAALVVVTPYQLDPSALYADAPGLSILSYAVDYLELSEAGIQLMLLGVLAASVLALLAAGRIHTRVGRVIAGGAAVFVLAWCVTAEIAAAEAAKAFSARLVLDVPQPLDWIDRATGGQPVLYLGQGILNPNQIQLVEFWNRSVHHVWSLDGTAPGPGPSEVPLVAQDGSLEPDPGIRWLVTDEPIDIRGRLVETRLGWRLFSLDGPARLQTAQTGVYSDGWMGRASAFSVYGAPDGRDVAVSVFATRTGSCGLGGSSEIRVAYGRLVLGQDGQPRLATNPLSREKLLRSCKSVTFSLPRAATPVRVEVVIPRTFVPAELDSRSSERRELGAQISFGVR